MFAPIAFGIFLGFFFFIIPLRGFVAGRYSRFWKSCTVTAHRKRKKIQAQLYKVRGRLAAKDYALELAAEGHSALLERIEDLKSDAETELQVLRNQIVQFEDEREEHMNQTSVLIMDRAADRATITRLEERAARLAEECGGLTKQVESLLGDRSEHLHTIGRLQNVGDALVRQQQARRKDDVNTGLLIESLRATVTGLAAYNLRLRDRLKPFLAAERVQLLMEGPKQSDHKRKRQSSGRRARRFAERNKAPAFVIEEVDQTEDPALAGYPGLFGVEGRESKALPDMRFNAVGEER